MAKGESANHVCGLWTPPSSLSAAEPMTGGAPGGDVGETLQTNVLDSPIVTAVQQGRKQRGQTGSAAKVGSPWVPAVGSMQLASGSPVLPEFFGEVPTGPASATLVTAAATGGAHTTAAVTTPHLLLRNFPRMGWAWNRIISSRHMRRTWLAADKGMIEMRAI